MATLERMCVCGHATWEHEDYNFDIHECNHDGCQCKQFLDVDESTPQSSGGKDG